MTFDSVKDDVCTHLKKNDRILIVGCGNSTFSADLYDAGYKNITNIDFSDVVIDRMKESNQERETMNWIKMDMCELDFPEGSFDVVIDKAAMDALMVDEGSVWDPATQVIDS